MGIRLNDALRLALVGQYGLARMMNLGRIEVYAGEPPAVAGDPVPDGNVFLGEITQDGLPFIPGNGVSMPEHGLQLAHSHVPGALTSHGDWVLTVYGSGQATWWRWLWSLAEGAAAPCIDGDINDGLQLPSVQLVDGTSLPIASFLIFLPPSV